MVAKWLKWPQKLPSLITAPRARARGSGFELPPRTAQVLPMASAELCPLRAIVCAGQCYQ